MKPAAILLVIALVPAAAARARAKPEARGHSADKPRFLSGSVVLADGSLPHRVTIERDCAGFTQPEALTDEKSRFRVNLEKYKRLVNDGSEEKPSDEPCDLRAVLAGFHPEVIRMYGTMRRDELDV